MIEIRVLLGVVWGSFRMVCYVRILLFVSVSIFFSLIFEGQHGLRSALNVWALIAMLFSEECM